MNMIINSHLLVALLPYLVSVTLSVGIGFFAWNRRAIAGATEFAIFSWAQASMTFGFMLEQLSVKITDKIFWDNLQFLGMFIGPAAFYMFTRSYTGRRISHPRLFMALVTISIVFFMLLVFTDPYHKLVRPSLELLAGDPFTSLVYDFTPLFWLMMVYVYVFLLGGVYILANQLAHSQPIYRRQLITLLVGVLVIFVGSIFSVLGVIHSFQRDITPFTFAVSDLIMAWGLFRYQLLDVVPVAHQLIVQSITDAVVVLDTRSRVIDMNPIAEKMSGRRLWKIIGQPAQEVFSFLPDIDQLLSDDAEIVREIEVAANGEKVTLDIRISTLVDNYGRRRGQVILARDVSSMKQAEFELKRRTTQLERANRKLEATNTRLHILTRAKDEFVSNVSHELRTPISNLKLYIDLLNIRPENQERYLNTLGRETNRLEDMIESLLMLSRLDQDRVSFRYQAVDLNDLVNEYFEDRRQLAESKGLRLEMQTTMGLPQVWADRALIGQVLSILLTNALNYTPEGGVVTVFTQTRQTDGKVWAGISVKDTGRGIPEDEQKQLFTRFFRGNAAQEAGVAGTGLGLAISKEIVMRHQGDIEVSSRGVPGLGTQFDVWLPSQSSQPESPEG